jgi:hypothetical protein
MILQYKTTAEAAVAAARVILRQCEESQTVKRVIHTASIASASPLKEGGAGAGYKDFISESCWTPLNVDYPLRSAHFDVSSEGSSDPAISLMIIFSRISAPPKGQSLMMDFNNDQNLTNICRSTYCRSCSRSGSS